MINNHPITRPSKELMQQWRHDACGPDYETDIATQAARWGADQELDACCEWLHGERVPGYAAQLRASRRPKPPSLKERALKELNNSEMDMSPVSFTWIRHALETLPND